MNAHILLMFRFKLQSVCVGMETTSIYKHVTHRKNSHVLKSHVNDRTVT